MRFTPRFDRDSRATVYDVQPGYTDVEFETRELADAFVNHRSIPVVGGCISVDHTAVVQRITPHCVRVFGTITETWAVA